MKKGVIVVVVLVIVIVVLVFLLLGKSGQEQQSSSQENTNEQKSTTQTTQNYITLKGIYGKIIGKLSPAEGKKIKGIVEIKLDKIPEGTNTISFVILSSGQRAEETGPNLGVDSNGDDGWGTLLDTNGYANGLYEIGVIANSAGSNEPIDAAQIQVIIEN